MSKKGRIYEFANEAMDTFFAPDATHDEPPKEPGEGRFNNWALMVLALWCGVSALGAITVLLLLAKRCAA